MGTKEKYIGKSKMTEIPRRPFIFKLINKCIKAWHIDDNAVQFSHLSLDALEGIKAWLEGHPPVPTVGVFDNTFDSTFA